MIDEHKFGSFVIDGKTYLGDIKLIGKKVRYWDRYSHKLKFEDLKELLEANPEILIIGTGNSGYLEVPSEIKDHLLIGKIKLIISTNVNAIEKYNKALEENKNVVAIFHATC